MNGISDSVPIIMQRCNIPIGSVSATHDPRVCDEGTPQVQQLECDKSQVSTFGVELSSMDHASIGLPPTACNGFGKAEFIRVPLPAARMIAVICMRLYKRKQPVASIYCAIRPL